jgi:hypothetical protein
MKQLSMTQVICVLDDKELLMSRIWKSAHSIA